MSRWKKFRYRLEYGGLFFAAWLVQRLPWRWLRPLGKIIGAAFFYIDHHRRAVTLANLEAAFGQEMNSKRRWEVGRKSYGVFAETFLELLWSPRLTPELVKEIGKIEEWDPNPCYRKKGVPAIYCSLHAGNYEWSGQVAAYYSEVFPVIAQKFKNPFLGSLFDRWRTSMGQQIFPQERAMLKMLRHLKSGKKIGVLTDLNLKPHQGPVIIRCFGRLLVPVTRLPAALALRTGAALIPVECYENPKGGYVYRYLPAIPIDETSTEESLTQACWDAFEPGLRQHPERWLWSYKHWRYKPSIGDTKHYPFYAHHFQSFDDLLQCSLCEQDEVKS
ncbi:MAG: hypothetical protein K2W99_05155 [Chthoniobacterales bacterium]|nr:hypothetical protein [Chthoniobacterales bacterium]